MKLNYCFGKIMSFVRLTYHEQSLTIAAFLLCGAFRIVILIIPFRYTAKFLNKRLTAVPADSNENIRKQVYIVARSVNRAAKFTPWDSKCLVRSLAAKALLRFWKYPNELYLGVRRDEAGKLIAHSWINSFGYNVSGGSNTVNSGYAVVGIFSDVYGKT